MIDLTDLTADAPPPPPPPDGQPPYTLAPRAPQQPAPGDFVPPTPQGRAQRPVRCSSCGEENPPEVFYLGDGSPLCEVCRAIVAAFAEYHRSHLLEIAVERWDAIRRLAGRQSALAHTVLSRSTPIAFIAGQYDAPQVVPHTLVVATQDTMTARALSEQAVQALVEDAISGGLHIGPVRVEVRLSVPPPPPPPPSPGLPYERPAV